MSLAQIIYTTLLRGFRATSPGMMRGSSKLARGLRGRSRAHSALAEWAEAERDSSRCTVWLHASSVGEALQGRAVLEALRARVPAFQTVFTFFSPSVEALAESFPADVSAYLPWDLPEAIGPVLEAVRPSLLIFTQKEVWPTLAAEAAQRGVPTALVAATLPADAGRLGVVAKPLLRPAFSSLRLVAAISAADGRRFGLLGVRPTAVVVTGDPGVDSASDRAEAASPDALHLRLLREDGRPVLVAGSTWGSDEDVLVPALARVRRAWPALRIVLAPHEPEAWDLEGLRARLAADGWAPTLLADAEDRGRLNGADAVLVERRGILAELYTVASMAYVGGGFHGRGLHSVLEPAAAGAPVLFGPHHRNSHAAVALLASGGARAVADADGVVTAVYDWLQSPEKLEWAGRQALAYVRGHCGAADRTASLLAECLTP